MIKLCGMCNRCECVFYVRVCVCVFSICEMVEHKIKGYIYVHVQMLKHVWQQNRETTSKK